MVNAVSGKTEYEKIKYFNEQLTTTNEYNTIVAGKVTGTAAPDCWECISALVNTENGTAGRTGTAGPVCEGYARAFKVLCDATGIECVLVDGQAVNNSGTGPHMWNYVQVGSNWYAVDVTWNDPSGGNGGAHSGAENEKWLLVGSETIIDGRTFCDATGTSSHPVENKASSGGVSFINGPALSTAAYQPPMEGVAAVSDGTKTIPYATFAEALSNWAGGTTLILLEDVEITETIKLNTGNTSHTLDLNGKELKRLGDWMFIVGEKDSSLLSSNSLTICDSGNGGKLTGAQPYAILVEKGSLTLDGVSLAGRMVSYGTIIMTGNSVVTDATKAIEIQEGGALELSGGRLSGEYGIMQSGGTVIISGEPEIEGTDADFWVYKGVLTFNTSLSEETVYSIYMSADRIGRFAVAEDGATISVNNFTAARDGYAVAEKEDGLYLLKEITDDMVSLNEAVVYNGNNQAPTVTVTDANTALVNDTDYKVTLYKVNSDNTVTEVTEIKHVGMYQVVVTGIGSYCGEVTKNFNITPATLTVAGATAEDREYDGTANVVITAVTLNSIVGSDAVTVNYTNLTGTVSGVNAGTYDAVTLPMLTLTGDEAGNYTLTQPTEAVAANVTISPKTVTPTITGVEISYVYTGDFIEPVVALKDGETVIPANEYSVGYSDNKDKGTATITVTDKENGNYSIGEITKTFIITDHVHDWICTVAGATITATCNGEGLCPTENRTATVTLSANGAAVYDGEVKPAFVTQTPADTFANVEIVYKDVNGNTLIGAPVNAGTYTAAITVGGTAVSVVYSIQAADLSDLISRGVAEFEDGAKVTLKNGPFTYNGSQIKPLVTITWNGRTLTEGTEYTLVYGENINAGQEEGCIEIYGIGNFDSANISYNWNFDIAKAVCTLPSEASFVQSYTKETFTVVLDDVVEIPETETTFSISATEDTGALVETSEAGYILTATITDGVVGQELEFPVKVSTNNYEDYIFIIKLTLNDRAEQSVSWDMDKINEMELIYGGSPVDLSTYIITGEGDGAITYTVGSVDGIGEATINGSFLTPVSAGEIYLIAHKAETEEYNAASSEKIMLYVQWARPTGSMTFSKVTEEGTMLSDVEVTIGYLDLDGNVLEGTIQWYERIENGHSPINSPETYEVQPGVEYNCEFRPTNTNYSWMAEDVVLWVSHDWTYAVNGTTITATCTKHTDCVVFMSISTTGSMVYDGTEKYAIIHNEFGSLLESPHIFYEKMNGDSWEVVNGRPVDAGDYCAFFTLGNKTAYLYYTVEKAPINTSDIILRFKSSVTYDAGNPVSVVDEIFLIGEQKAYFSTSTNNSTWSEWTETIPTMSQTGILYVKAKVVEDENHEEYVTAVSTVRMTNPSGGSDGGGSYYPPYYPPYTPSYPTYPVATPTPVPTAAPTPVPTVAPTEAPKPTEAPVPTVTPVPGTVTVESAGNAVVDENGEEITSIIQEPGTTNKLNVPGLTDVDGAEPVWKSTNPDVAEVDENGNVTLKAPGLAEVVVTVGEGEDAKTETIVVYVEEPRKYVNPVEEAFKDVRLGTSWGDIPLVRYQAVGETIDINFWGVKNWEKENYDYVWMTSDDEVATVDSKGRITAVKPGVVSLTLGLKNKTNGNLLNVQSVEVVIPENTEEKILLGTSRNDTFDSIELKLNERIDINFYGVKNWKKDEYEYHWSSSEPSVVYVDSVGKLTPVSPGSAEVFLVLVEKKTGAPKQVIL